MRHWLSLFLLLAAIMFLGSLGVGAQGGLELKGHLNANDTEREEGYFALAQDTGGSRRTPDKRCALSSNPRQFVRRIG